MNSQGLRVVMARILLALMFVKNLAVTGGLLFVFAYGAGASSLDARRATA